MRNKWLIRTLALSSELTLLLLNHFLGICRVRVLFILDGVCDGCPNSTRLHGLVIINTTHGFGGDVQVGKIDERP